MSTDHKALPIGSLVTADNIHKGQYYISTVFELFILFSPFYFELIIVWENAQFLKAQEFLPTPYFIFPVPALFIN